MVGSVILQACLDSFWCWVLLSEKILERLSEEKEAWLATHTGFGTERENFVSPGLILFDISAGTESLGG